MEPTDPLTPGEGEWSDVEDDADAGVIEGFDDENWACDGSKEDVNAVGETQRNSKEPDIIRDTEERTSASPIPDSVHTDVKSTENAGVDNNDDAAAENSATAVAADKWGFGSTLTAFAGALQQDVKEISESMKNAIQHVKEEFQGSPESFHGLEPTRPEGPIALDRSPFDNDDFQQGLEAIDDQVDQLASAAGKALGSFWTGIGGALSTGMQAATNIAGQIETAAVQAASRVSETTKEHVPWGGHGGAFRSSGGGTLMMPNGGNLEDEWQVVDLLGSPSTSVAASFEQLFKLYRGPRFVDDLEALGNEAARSCNRIRALLPADKRDELDAIVARTSAFINLIATVPPSSDSHSAARALTQHTPPSSVPGSVAAAAATGGPREGLSTMCIAAVQRAQSMGVAVSLSTHESAWEGLCRLRAEGLKLLAEFTALSVQHVSFLAMCLEGGDAEAAKLEFSADGKNKGAVVRQVLLQLVSDTNAIYEAFHSALVAVTDSPEFVALASMDVTAAGRARAAVPALEGEAENKDEAQADPPPRDAGQGTMPDRDLVAVAKELKRGLDIGVGAAMDRILQLGVVTPGAAELGLSTELIIKRCQASKHLLYPICAPAAEQLRAKDSIFAGGHPDADTAGSSQALQDASGEGGDSPAAEVQGVTVDDIDISGNGSEPGGVADTGADKGTDGDSAS